MEKEAKKIKIYFEYKGFKVIDCESKDFANYEVTNTNECFDEFEMAVLYCLGAAQNKNTCNLRAYAETFYTMITKD